MDPRISIVTLGVDDVDRARRFYEALGWTVSPRSQGDIVFFQAGGMVLALYPWRLLAEDAGVDADGTGFRRCALAHNVGEKGAVAAVLEQVERAGGRIVKPAQDVFWGGHSGYFADPDDHLWEVAFNPFWQLQPDGSLVLPPKDD